MRLALLALILVLSGCDSPPDRDVSTEGPSVVGSNPADGDQDVPRNGPFFFDFDRRLLPRSVMRATVRIESGVTGYFLSLRFDPIDRRIVMTSFGQEILEPRVQYRMTVEDVRDLDDLPLDEPFVVTFKTGNTVVAIDPPRTATYADVAPLLTARCAGATCHGPGGGVLGLDLATPEAIRATAIGRAATQARAGTISREGAGGAFGLSGLPIIDVIGGYGRPASSYLLYKLLGDEHIIGERMPPDEPLTEDEIRLVSAWILAGAPTE